MSTKTEPVWNFVPLTVERGAYKVGETFTQNAKNGREVSVTVGLVIPFATADGHAVDLLISTAHMERAETAAAKLFAADDGSDIAARWGVKPARKSAAPRKSNVNGTKEDISV